MEQKLRAKLKDDETLLWWGTPTAFAFMDTTHKAGYIKKWVGILVGCAAVLAWYLSYVAKTGAEIHPAMLVILAVVAVYGCISDWLDARKLQKKVIYGLSNNRILVMQGGSLEGVDYQNVLEYTFDTDADGHTSLLCGDWPVTEKSNLRRMGTVRGVCNDCDTGICESVVMYAISDADKQEIVKILSEKIAA